MYNLQTKPMKTVKLTSLIGTDVKGMRAQITNPKHLTPENELVGIKARVRTLTKIEVTTERGKRWVTLYWERQPEDNCNFTGCTIESDVCEIQLIGK